MTIREWGDPETRTTVAELIEALSHFPPDTHVWVHYHGEDLAAGLEVHEDGLHIEARGSESVVYDSCSPGRRCHRCLAESRRTPGAIESLT